MTEEQNPATSNTASQSIPNGGKESEAEARRLRDLLNRIEEGLIETDAGGRVRWINASAERITGWPAAEAANLPAETVFHWAGVAEAGAPANPFSAARANGSAETFEPPAAVQSRRGTRILVSGRVAPLGNDPGRPDGYLIQFRDRTREIRERERETHCKRVLLAVREVGRMAMEETDARKLIERTCQSLTQGLGYFNAWIALTDPDGKWVTETAQSGLAGEFEGLDAQLRSGNFPRCMKRALRKAGVAVTREPSVECGGCPWAEENAGRAALSGPMIFRNRLYGVLSVAAPADFSRDAEAQAVFLRLTEDVASALGAIETQKERHLFSQMVQATPQPMSLVSREGRYRIVNRAYTGLLGRDRAEIIGQPVTDFFDPSFIDREIRPRLDRCLAGEAQEFELQVPYPEKGPRWMRFSYTPFRETDGEITGVAIHGLDVTDRQRAEERSWESENRYRRLVEGLPDLIFICDEKGTFLEYHVQSEEMLYLPPERFMGHRIETVLPKPLADEIMSEIEQIRAGFSPPAAEYSLTKKDGIRHYERRAFPFEANRILFIVRDVTERKLAGDRLRFQAHLLEAVRQSVVVTDTQGRVVYWNPFAEQMYGWSAEEAVGRTTIELISHEESRGQGEEIMARLQRGESWTGEYLARRREGTAFPVHANCAPIFDEAGNLSHIIGVSEDVSERKREEQRRRESENRYRNLVQTIPYGIEEVDLEGRTTFINDAYHQMLGYAPGELAGRHIWDHEPNPEGGRRLREYFAFIVREQPDPEPYISKNRKKNGELIDVFVDWNYLRDPEGNLSGFIAVVTDITESKRAEARLLASEERFRHIAATIPGVIYQFRLKTDGEFDFPFMSDGARDIFGVTPAQAAADIAAVMETVHPEDRAKLEARLSVSAETLTPYNIVHRVIPRPGHVRWIKASSIPTLMDDGAIVWNGVAIDITEQIEAEEKLRTSRERLRLAMEASRDGLWDWDVAADSLFTNRAYGDILGYGPGELPRNVGPIAELIHPEDRENALRANFDCIENRCETFAVEFRMKAKDGSWRWILGRGKAVARDEAGRATRLVGTHTDITRRKAADEEKSRLEAQVHHAQKMESIGRLAGGVAHDLNNLLSPILGYSEMLIMETPEDDPNAGILEEIEKAGIRARDLVRQLLTFSRKQPVKFQTLNLNRLLQNFEKLLRRTVKENIALEMRLCPKPVFIRGDAGQLEQVVMNLAVNAQDAMPEGGRLILETGRLEGNGPVGGEGDGKTPPRARLWVRDNGTGMDKRTRERLFEPFFTTKAVGKGTGLGLATVYGIVQQHGGKIGVESEPGAGTVFQIDLPAAEEAPEPAPMRPRLRSAESPRGRETILVAEDEPAVRELVHHILTNQGYAVIVKDCGTEALAALNRHEGPVHLLLTDVVMPDMSGLQLYRRVSELRPETRVLYMSGYADEAIARQGVIMKEVNFIQKPFNVKNLAAKIREVLDGKTEKE